MNLITVKDVREGNLQEENEQRHLGIREQGEANMTLEE